MSRNWIYSFKNLFKVIFHPNFQSAEGLERQTALRYGEPLELGFYGNPANWEYLPQELEIFDEINKTSGQSVLVVGCGAGREFLKLNNQKLAGIDSCEVLVARCRELFPDVEIKKGLKDTKDEHFDIIYISLHVYNHIQGQEHRLQFLKDLLRILKSGGRLYFHVDQFDIYDGWKFWLAGQILKVRWLFSHLKWERGDTVRGYNGSHNPEGRIFYYHYFCDSSEVRKELDHLGTRYQEKKDHWIIEKRSF